MNERERESAFRCFAIEPSFKCETIKIGTQLAHLHRYQSNGKQIEKKNEDVIADA